MKAKSVYKFTLLELLIVIAVIAILAGLLLPALRNAKELSLKISCNGDLKQIGSSLFMYCDDSSGVLPVSKWGSGSSSYTPEYFWFGILNDTYIKKKNIFTDCRVRLQGNHLPSSVAYDYRYISYGANLRILSDAVSGMYRKLAAVSSPSRKIIFGDSTDYVQNSDFRGYVINYVPVSGYPDFRHINRANYAFVDGHIDDKGRDVSTMSIYGPKLDYWASFWMDSTYDASLIP